MHNSLFLNWQQTLQPFEVDPITVEKVFTYLVEAYSNPNRHYHTLKHIHHVLNTIQTLQAHTNDLIAVQLAAWFHDVVYDTQSPNNEEKSANYAVQWLSSLGIPANTITYVTRLILNTKHHQAAVDDFDSQVLLDADLAILATPPIRYQEYAHAIRQEYIWIPQAEYRVGRRQVLEKFLQRQRIYFTPLMFDTKENIARLNIKAEIKILNQQ
ncbi:MAG: hypothetical protein KME21_08650 [Desmonostoc vinosum HA7617-LM4]|jgi:predicted metal-dependent HD superfamily phosphohydrolase|nr:hypothetical protein [Desmonostoc vinosum HA7617-LM4]